MTNLIRVLIQLQIVTSCKFGKLNVCCGKMQKVMIRWLKIC